MLLDALILSIIIGWIRGGKLERLDSFDFRYWWVAILAFVFQLALPLVGKSQLLGRNYSFYLLMASYVLLFFVIGANWKNIYVKIMGLGIGLNFIVILLNGGMPVSLGAMYKIGGISAIDKLERSVDFVHIPMKSSALLKFLADIIIFPSLYPRPGFAVTSIGDVFLSIGIFFLIQEGMSYKGRHERKPQVASHRPQA
ncbi:MAG: DUF5317 domain-containing protein [Actinobacteria bacterium]|nr:DUF5317 domain-containing protein [Actinomycetota bacterium]